MAEARISQDQFNCPVCLDLLKDPVTIPCGHSYCMSCIADCWNQVNHTRVYRCPQCRKTFTPRPALCKNVIVAEVVEKLKKRKLQAAHCYAGSEDVECDVCTGRKFKAVKSCLDCLNSYCQDHLEQHENHFKDRRHNLMDPTRRLHEMLCPQHKKHLDIYCRTDQECICYLCTLNNHKKHDVVAPAEERTGKQKLLEETQKKFQQKIQERVKELQVLREAVKTHKCSAETAVKESERIFTELIRTIERCRSEVIQLIRDREKAAVSRAEDVLRQLEKEIGDLKRRNAELEQLLHTNDDIYFLQRFQSLSAAPQSTVSHSITVSSALSFDVVRNSVFWLKEKLEDYCGGEIEMISDKVTYVTVTTHNEPKARTDFLQYFRQFTLDTNTMHKRLRLFDGNRAATYTHTVQQYADHPDRFYTWRQVLCRERVCGRCYWEVKWSGKCVYISVSYKSISRKESGIECGFGFNDQSWSLSCSSSGHRFGHNDSWTDVPAPSSSSRIGVYVDQSAGTLSFYSVSDKMTLIHSVRTTFTQPLYPGFYVNVSSLVKVCNLIK